MELNINSPSYFSAHHGVDDEVYWMCRELCKFVKDKEYSTLVDMIGVTPIAAPSELIEKGQWKEYTKYAIKSNLIIVNKHIDYEKYVTAPIEEKKKYMVGNILKSIKSIKVKGKIDYLQFEKEVLEFLGYTKEEIKSYE